MGRDLHAKAPAHSPDRAPATFDTARGVAHGSGMKLFHTPTSPFVRKVMVTAHELGAPLATVFLRPSPMAPDATLSASNPLSKIPALVLDPHEGGEVLYDSPVICEYLDATFGPRLLPAAGPERWRTLKLQALADGVLDAGILVFYERTQRPKELHWEAWLAGQTTKVLQGLDALDALAADWGDGPDAVDLGRIAAACALGWLAFRDVVGPMREGRERLFAWYDRFAQRPSMVATAPH